MIDRPRFASPPTAFVPVFAMLVIALALVSVARAETPAKKKRTSFPIGYVSLSEDPYYQPRRAYTGLTLREPKRPLDGVKTGLREARVIARSLGLRFDLIEISTQADSLARAIEETIEKTGAGVFVLDLPRDPMRAVADHFKDRDIILFNPRHHDDDLRAEHCSKRLFHTLPSQAMRTDALAQFLRKKGWTRTLLLQGPSAADNSFGTAFRTSAKKFNLDIVDTRAFVLSNDPRRRDQTNVALLTGGSRQDVIVIADAHGEYSRYVPYQTVTPDPVVGLEGLVPGAWHWTWERHGAPQLNQRFDRQAKRLMGATDWAGWASIKAIVAALRFGRPAERGDIPTPKALAAALSSPDLAIDLYKGVPGSFRPWNNQLRQPVLLHTHNAVVARAPLEEYLHQTNVLDTLGRDVAGSACRFR